MTDLQTSLIVIGVMIVGGVVCYNKWHEFRARKHVERAFSNERDDVLMKPVGADLAAERQEPVLDAGAFSVATDDPSAGDHLVGDYFNGASAQVASATSFTQHEEILPVDDQIDCVIPLSLETPVRGEKLLPLLQTLRHVGSKPVHYMGLTQPSAQSPQPEWRAIVHGGIYTDLQAGVQLANRSGALNELEYSELIVRLRQIADEIGAEPMTPEMSQVMHSAKVLHQFVSQHDARLGLSILSNGVPWAVSTLLVALERLGFDVRPDGRFVMQDADGTVLFTLTTNEPVTAEYTTCLTLLMDVPRIAAHQEGFGAMLSCARMLAKRLNGTIVDDGRLALPDAALEEIGQQVYAFYDEMQAAGVPAGSPRALRLFT
ncbi:MAG: cell division protein [Oxalobacter sp.]|nr:MAG: cell division protein [Oxalobacter sp.]